MLVHPVPGRTMKRASYRAGIDWVAFNDFAGSPVEDGDPEIVGELISSTLLGDLFDVDYAKVGADVVRRRKRMGLI
jgi:hypothetical protein